MIKNPFGNNIVKEYIKTFLQTGKYNDSDIASIKEYIKLHTKSIDHYLLLANLYSIKREYKNAISIILKAIKISPHNYWLYDFLFKLVLFRTENENDYSNAHKTFQIATNLMKKNGLMKKADVQESRKIALNILQAFCYRKKGHIYQGQNKFKEAQKYFSKSYTALPIVPSIYIFLANSYFNLKEYSNALKISEEGVKSFIELPSMHMMLGHLYLNRSEYKKALNEFQIIKKLIEDVNKEAIIKGIAERYKDKEHWLLVWQRTLVLKMFLKERNETSKEEIDMLCNLAQTFLNWSLDRLDLADVSCDKFLLIQRKSKEFSKYNELTILKNLINYNKEIKKLAFCNNLKELTTQIRLLVSSKDFMLFMKKYKDNPLFKYFSVEIICAYVLLWFLDPKFRKKYLDKLCKVKKIKLEKNFDYNRIQPLPNDTVLRLNTAKEMVKNKSSINLEQLILSVELFILEISKYSHIEEIPKDMELKMIRILDPFSSSFGKITLESLQNTLLNRFEYLERDIGDVKEQTKDMKNMQQTSRQMQGYQVLKMSKDNLYPISVSIWFDKLPHIKIESVNLTKYCINKHKGNGEEINLRFLLMLIKMLSEYKEPDWSSIGFISKYAELRIDNHERILNKMRVILAECISGVGGLEYKKTKEIIQTHLQRNKTIRLAVSPKFIKFNTIKDFEQIIDFSQRKLSDTKQGAKHLLYAELIKRIDICKQLYNQKIPIIKT